MRHIAYLSLGSNIGDREDNLRQAIWRLGELGRVSSISSFYETEPVEFTEQPWFLNCAVALETHLTAPQLLQELLRIELEMGRQRIQKNGPRTIDIDILLFGDLVVNAPDLSIPHPAIASRRFVLSPLSEIAPHVLHPVLKKTVRELLDELPPGQIVRRSK